MAEPAEPVAPSRAEEEGSFARDARARRLAQTRFDRPLVLEAGAGTGKTTALVARIVAWCMGPGWADDLPPDRAAARALEGVVAITFTEAAAAEMATRLGEALAALEAGQPVRGLLPDALPSPAVEARARALLGATDRLQALTIHAFCRRLLATWPVEAGLHPRFEVDAEGEALAAVAREVVEERLEVALGPPADPDLLALAARGMGPADLLDAVVALAGNAVPADALAGDPLDEPRRAALAARVRAAAAALEPLLAGRPLRGNAAKIAEGLRQVPSARAPPVGDLQAALREAFLPSLTDHLGDWARRKLNKGESAAFAGVEDELASAASSLRRLLRHVERLDPDLLALGRRVLHPLLLEVETRARARGVVSFSALLRDARDLLAGDAAVRAAVGASIRQLLVDEFQDTDPVQCEIVRLIALDGPQDKRPGLFIVGDPKQSIYGWRNADLQAYEDFVGEVVAAGGEVASLTVNFRSAPPILREVEHVVGAVMRPEPGLQPSFEPLVPCPANAAASGFTEGPYRPVEYHDCRRWEDGAPARKTLAAEAVEIEARSVAAELARLHRDHGVPWREFGLLFRAATDIDEVLRALREAGVPYAVERDKSYYRRREVIDAAAWVRTVLDPLDHLAMLTWLRSAWVGVPDAALLPLWEGGFPRLVSAVDGRDPAPLEEARRRLGAVARRLRDLPGIDAIAGWEDAAAAAIGALSDLRGRAHALPPDRLADELRRVSLLEPTEAARYLGAWRLANLGRFFRRLEEDLEEGGPSAALRNLRAGARGAREAEEGRPGDAGEEAVRVMTVHKAKGLDFRHTYLLQVHKGTAAGHGPGTAGARVAGAWEVCLLGAPGLGWDRVEERQAAVAEAERVRLLYVALTRAKDRLVVSGAFAARPGSMVELLQESRTEDPAAFAPDYPGDRAVGDGALWVFPGRCPTAPEPAAARDPVDLPSPGQVAADSAHLARLREDAAARMRRPWAAAASAEAHGALRTLLHAERAEEEVPPFAPATDDGLAMAAGSAIHRALEEMDLAADPVRERARLEGLLPDFVYTLVGPDRGPAAVRRASTILDRLFEGGLVERLRALGPHVVARELPVLLPPAPGGDPVGYVAGAVDLVYRRPDDGSLVVADYKTDAVSGEADLRARAAVYALQGAAYVRAVREAFDLEQDPTFELWFLQVGRVVEV